MKLSARKVLYCCVAAVLVTCVFALYARTFGYNYVWDDCTYLYEYRHYFGVRGVVRALAEPFIVEGYYRPLATLSFPISPEPAAQHAINVLLHAVNTVLVLYVARALMPAEVAGSRAGLLAAALGALVFAVHPVGVEAVAWVSGRFDTQMCMFVLGTCLVALGGELTRRRLALVFVLFFAAMCSKESAIGLPVAMPFLLLLKWRMAGVAMDTKEQRGQLVRLLAVQALAVAVYAVARLAVMRTLFAGSAPVRSESFVDRLNIAALAVVEFAKLLVNPWSNSAPLHPFSYEAGNGLLLRTVVVLGVVVALLLLAGFKKWSFPLAFLAALAMSWPTLHFIGIPNSENAIISDRYALAPLALLLVSLAASAGTWLAWRLPAMNAGERRVLVYTGVLGLLWTGALAAYSHVTIPLWRNDNVLWQFAHVRVPESMVAHGNYISYLIRQERWQDADAEFQKFWQQHPNARNNMRIDQALDYGLVRAYVGDHAGAMDLVAQVEHSLTELREGGEDTDSAFADLYRNRGLIEESAGDWERAAYYLGKSFEIEPGGAAGRVAFLYAEALFMAGQAEKAEEVFNRALAGSTADVAAWALEWRKTWRLPEAAAEGAAQGASAAASAPAP